MNRGDLVRRSALAGSALAFVLLAAGAGTTDADAAYAARAPHAPADRDAELAKGKFLVAARDLRDPNFHHTVVLLLEYDEHGALGLVVNQPTEVALASVLPDVEGLRGRPDRVFIGGPVQRERLIVLFHADTLGDAEGEPVIDGVWVSASADTLRTLTGPDSPVRELRAFVGYAGWSAGQLDNEVERGGWLVVPADAEAVFAGPATDIWNDLIRRNSGRWVRGAPGAQAACGPVCR